MINKTFIEWLKGELRQRHWSQARLARESGLTQPAISLLLSGQRSVGAKGVKAIAKALNVPEARAFQAAGIMAEEPETNITAEQMLHLMGQLNEDDQDILIDMANTMIRRRLGTEPNKSANPETIALQIR